MENTSAAHDDEFTKVGLINPIKGKTYKAESAAVYVARYTAPTPAQFQALGGANLKTAPKFSFTGMVVAAKIVKVYDGDTCTAVFHHKGTLIRHQIRLLDFNSWEMRGVTPEVKSKAEAMRDYLAELVLGKVIMLVCEDFDKYGRILGRMYTDSTFTDSINTRMVSKMVAIEAAAQLVG